MTGQGLLIFAVASIPGVRSIQPHVQWVPGALSLGVKRPRREATTHLHLVPRSKNKWSYTSTPPYAFTAWCSVKAQGQIYFYLTGGHLSRDKALGREVDHSPLYDAEVRNEVSYTSSPHTPSLGGTSLSTEIIIPFTVPDISQFVLIWYTCYS
jgi:hypothetical protein